MSSARTWRSNTAERLIVRRDGEAVRLFTRRGHAPLPGRPHQRSSPALAVAH
jgi:hypothetical protein